MTTLSTFQINQPPGSSYGTWDRSRRDIELYSVASEAVELEALEKTQTSYLWEMVSGPYGVSVTINNDTTHTCNFQIVETGSYIFQLTVNAGAPNEAITSLEILVALENTGLFLPAMNETNQDNSLSPFTGERGYEEKQNAINRKVDFNTIIENLETAGSSGKVPASDGAGGLIMSFVGAPSGNGDIFVDETNGDDSTGTGANVNPFKTLAYAATTVAAPTSFAEFSEKCRFVLAPGTYPGDVTLPKRLEIEIAGDNYEVSGKVYWNYDLDDWFGETSYYNSQQLTISSESLLKGLFSDTISAQNSNPTAGGGIDRTLTVEGVEVSGSIWNYASGDNDKANSTGRLTVTSDTGRFTGGVAGSGASIGGHIENITADYEPNPVSLVLSDCQVQHYIYGCVEFMYCRDTAFYGDIDYFVEPSSGSGPYGGNIGGCSSLPERGFQGCYFHPTLITTFSVGWDRKNHSTQIPSEPIAFDTTSYNSALNKGVTGLVRLVSAGFIAEAPFVCSDDGFNDSIIVVPVGPSAAESGMALRSAYERAKKLIPGGSALSDTNQAEIHLPPGWYHMGLKNFELDTDYINLVGLGTPANGSGTSTQHAGVVITGEPPTGDGVLYQTASTVRITNISVEQAIDDSPCFLHDTQATDSVYRGMSFHKDLSVSGVRAVTSSRAVIDADWYDCHTGLPGFLQPDSLSDGAGLDAGGTLQRCSAGDGSFGGTDDVTVEHNNQFSGAAEDCHGGNFCFGASADGGNCSFTGTAVRCAVSSNGFGSSSGVGRSAPYVVTCSGSLTDCDNGSTGGLGSFGYCESGDATCSATLRRCRSGHLSFGASDYAFGAATFDGDATGCDGGRYSFGANGNDPTQSWFTGEAIGCSAYRYSFGARGSNVGSLIRCRAFEYGCFGNQTSVGAAYFEDCVAEGISATFGGPIGLYGATVVNCVFKSLTGSPVILNGDGTNIYQTKLYSADASAGVDVATTATARLAHCIMNVDVAVGITNQIGSGYNVVDSAFVL